MLIRKSNQLSKQQLLIIPLDISADTAESEANATLSMGLPSAIQPALPPGGSSEEMQFNGDCWMPAYDSKVVVERSPKKILQELEKRLLFPLSLDLDVEVASLNELQSAMLGKDKMEGYRLVFNKSKIKRIS